MHYTGTIDESSETGEKGLQFDSSRGREDTFDFQIGQGMVIQGWDQGILGLCKGAKVRHHILINLFLDRRLFKYFSPSLCQSLSINIGNERLLL
jgi:hypothetical protein